MQEDPAGRRVAVLGDMLELGAGEAEHHREIGADASGAGVELLVAVGPRAAAMVDALRRRRPRRGGRPGGPRRSRADIVAPGDVLLVKGSRGVGLEIVADALAAAG